MDETLHMDETLQKIITNWYNELDIKQKGHYLTTLRFEKYHYGIGLPSTILSAVAGASFLTAQSNPVIKIIAGSIALLAAIFAAIMTFYSYSKRSEQHRTSAAHYNDIKRQLSYLPEFFPESPKEQEKVITEINMQISAIDDDALPIPVDIMKKLENPTFLHSVVQTTSTQAPSVIPEMLMAQVRSLSLDQMTSKFNRTVNRISTQRK